MNNASPKSLFAVVSALPWCCIIPGVLGLASLSGATASRFFFTQWNPVFAVLSLLLLGWAHYLLHVRKQGNRFSRVSVWASTVFVIVLWGSRFSF